MNTIQELTEQLFHEGVEKGNQEAGAIVAAARKQSEDLLSEAKKQAEAILADAGKKAAELDKNTKAELKLFAAQSVEALKSEVVDLLNGKVVEAAVEQATSDKNFMQQMLLTFVQNWASKGELCIETADEAALTAFFKAKAAEELKKGLQIRQVNGNETDFTLAAADGSYKIQFGKQDFVEYFKEFLRPRLVEMLF